MQWSKTCAAIIPCWNESLTIAGLVRQLQGVLPTVYVIDDGSTDGTGPLAAEVGGRVLVHAVNRGKGAALRTGLEEACRAGYQWAVLLDGDGQHAPSDLEAFFARAEQSQVDLVVGNRMVQAQRISWVRRVTNRWMSRQISRLAGSPLADSQCGFRLVRLEPWSRMTFCSARFETESEMLLAFVRAGFRVGWVPVAVRESCRPSRIRMLPDTWRWLRWRWAAARAIPSRAVVAPCCPLETVS